ncbi:MAG: TIGR03084 family protein [Acidimicrobiia bacterium]|nr:TIGR03084 family protein [Acidimicrobiia bacterium]
MTLAPLLADLAAEHDALDAVVGPIPAARWDAPTPAPGWAVRHQFGHLIYFDEQATLAATDPDAFAENRDLIVANRGSFDLAGPAAALPADEILAAWRAGRAGLLAAFVDVDPRARLPWYGPPMSARSFLTARLMETWAHGVDVHEAVGAPVLPTARLRHVAHIGVTTRSWSYVVRGEEPPASDVRVELDDPDGGERWTWGDEAATDVVRGAALDFCLVATQRRAVDDTALEVVGPAAADWMAKAQAFAGGPTATTRR